MAFWYNVFVFDTPCCVINGLLKKGLEILQSNRYYKQELPLVLL